MWVSILTKMKTPPIRLTVTAEGERADAHPKIFTRIHLRYTVIGSVPEAKLDRAIRLSAQTYCSVGVMLGDQVKIEHSFEISSE